MTGATFRRRVSIVRDSQQLQEVALALSARVLTVDAANKDEVEEVQRLLREVQRLTGELVFNVAMAKGLM